MHSGRVQLWGLSQLWRDVISKRKWNVGNIFPIHCWPIWVQTNDMFICSSCWTASLIFFPWKKPLQFPAKEATFCFREKLTPLTSVLCNVEIHSGQTKKNLSILLMDCSRHFVLEALYAQTHLSCFAGDKTFYQFSIFSVIACNSCNKDLLIWNEALSLKESIPLASTKWTTSYFSKHAHTLGVSQAFYIHLKKKPFPRSIWKWILSPSFLLLLQWQVCKSEM